MSEEAIQKKDVYIFTGGLLIESFIKTIDLNAGIIIGVDKGAEWLIDRGITPDYLVGDFDSVSPSFNDKLKSIDQHKIYYSLPEKDETDTELGMRLAIKLNPRKIIILGGTGTRLDHVMANIHTLLQGEEAGVNSIIEGSNNRIQLLIAGQEKRIEKSNFSFISLIAFSNEVTGIYIDGFKYPLNNGVMHLGKPYGVSNELIKKSGTISIKQGILLIVESKD